MPQLRLQPSVIGATGPAFAVPQLLRPAKLAVWQQRPGERLFYSTGLARPSSETIDVVEAWTMELWSYPGRTDFDGGPGHPMRVNTRAHNDGFSCLFLDGHVKWLQWHKTRHAPGCYYWLP